MPDSQPQRAARRRRWPWVLAALLLIAGGSGLVLRHYTRPQQVTQLLVSQARSVLGIDLSLGGTARYGFWPKVHAVLPQAKLQAPGATAAIVRADRLEAMIAWRNLWASRYEIERINVIRPQIDLDALSAWLATRPPSNAPVPDLRFALHVEEGTLLSGGKPIAQGVTLDFANSNDIAAWIAQIGPHMDTLLPPLNGHGKASSLHIGDTQLDDVRIELRGDQPPSPRRP